MSTLQVFEDADLLLRALAEFVIARADDAIKKKGRFSWVLSGGSSPKRLYELLASDGYRKKIEWDKVFFFFGDERYVAADHPDSNFLMSKKTLFAPLNISPGQVFRMNAELSPDEAALAYERDLRGYFLNEPVCFDLVLLGLGDNSHTASLFPHTSVLHETDALVKAVYVEEVKMYRITLTAPCINLAACIAFLVYGASKAEAVHHILKGERDIDAYPAQLIHPTKGECYWFLDAAAGEKVSP